MKHLRSKSCRDARIGFAWLLAVSLVVPAVWCAAQDSDIEIRLGNALTSAGASVEVPVEIAYNEEEAPTSLLFFIEYDPEFVTPDKTYFELHEIDELGLPIIDLAGNTRTESSAIRLDDALRRAGKYVDATVYAEEGVIGVFIAGAPDIALPQGALCTLAFAADSEVALSFIAYLRGVATEDPIELDGDNVASLGSASTNTSLSVDFQTGKITFQSCNSTPDRPKNVVASTDRPDGVRIAWDAVEGDGVEYRVYRADTPVFQDAVPLGAGWQAATAFVDISAEAAGDEAAAGCFRPAYGQGRDYYYWVKARSESGCEGKPNRQEQLGRRIASLSTPRNVQAALDVLPGRSAGGPVLLTEDMSMLAIRLSSDKAIDPNSVVGSVSSESLSAADIEWIPALDREPRNTRARAGWAVYRPQQPWVGGEVVTFTVSAKTLQGRALPSVTRQFALAPDAEGSTMGASALSMLALGLDETPGLSEGLGTPYRVEPSEIFASMQLIWLPVPPERKLRQVELYYFSDAEGDGRWVRGRDMAGWLGSQVEEKTEAGITYAGYWIRHGGIVQLGLAPGKNDSKTESAAVGEVLLTSLVLLSLLAARKRAAQQQ